MGTVGSLEPTPGRVSHNNPGVGNFPGGRILLSPRDRYESYCHPFPWNRGFHCSPMGLTFPLVKPDEGGGLASDIVFRCSINGAATISLSSDTAGSQTGWPQCVLLYPNICPPLAFLDHSDGNHIWTEGRKPLYVLSISEALSLWVWVGMRVAPAYEMRSRRAPVKEFVWENGLRKVWGLPNGGCAVNLACPALPLLFAVGLMGAGGLSEPCPLCRDMGIEMPPSQGLLRIG